MPRNLRRYQELKNLISYSFKSMKVNLPSTFYKKQFTQMIQDSNKIIYLLPKVLLDFYNTHFFIINSFIVLFIVVIIAFLVFEYSETFRGMKIFEKVNIQVDKNSQENK